MDSLGNWSENIRGSLFFSAILYQSSKKAFEHLESRIHTCVFHDGSGGCLNLVTPRNQEIKFRNQNLVRLGMARRAITKLGEDSQHATLAEGC